MLPDCSRNEGQIRSLAGEFNPSNANMRNFRAAAFNNPECIGLSPDENSGKFRLTPHHIIQTTQTPGTLLDHSPAANRNVVILTRQ